MRLRYVAAGALVCLFLISLAGCARITPQEALAGHSQCQQNVSRVAADPSMASIAGIPVDPEDVELVMGIVREVMGYNASISIHQTLDTCELTIQQGN